ncbi:MAG: hypothetical protein Fues2KO_26720 [Fuerstiella sp.]
MTDRFTTRLITGAFALLVSLATLQQARSEEFWYEIRLDNRPVGYEHLRIEPQADVDQVICTRRTNIRVKRLGKNLTLAATLNTTQTNTGQLLSFQLHRVDGEGKRIERSGQYDARQLEFQLEEKVSATRRRSRLRLRQPPQSPLLSTWLWQKSVTSGSRRNAAVLSPETGDVAQMWSVTRTNRSLRQPTGTIQGTEILTYPQLDPGKTTTYFFDLEGKVVQQEQRLLGGELKLILSDAATALQAVSSDSIDLDVRALVPIDRLLSSPANRERLVMNLILQDGVLPQIPDTAFQKVRRLSHNSVQIALTRPTTSVRRTVPASARRTMIEPTHWMPTDNPTLHRMAAVAAAGHSDPAEVCRRLQRYVHSKLRRSAFSTGLQPADMVAKQLRGDCTEHAILLCTLMRIHGIPSRVVAGLTQSGSQYGFVGHAWAEARIGDSWIPFDSTSDADVGATHIHLAHSELPDDVTNPIVLFLPLLEISGRASLKIVEDR